MTKKEIKLFVVLDDGKSHSISWGTSYVSGTKSLPAVTAQQSVYLTPGTSRQNGKSKRKTATVKSSGSPRRK